MAVTLNNSPSARCCVDEDIIWGISIDSLGTPGVDTKCISYQLKDATGAIISENEIAPVAVGHVHRLNFMADIRRNLQTEIPALFVNTVQNALGVKKYRLYYGETTLNLTTAMAYGFPPTNQSAEVTVVNAAANNWIDLPTTFPTAKVLTFKPFQNFFCSRAFDWLYIWGVGTVTILKDYAFAGGNYTGTTVATLTAVADRVNCIPIGYRNHSGLNGVESYIVKVECNGNTQYHLFTCAPEPVKDMPCQVVYFDPGGGYTALDGELLSVATNADKEEFNIARPNKSITAGGKTQANAKGYVSYKFRRRMPQSRDEIEQITRFVSSESYLIPVQTMYFEGLVKFRCTDSITVALASGDYIEMTLVSAHPILSANGKIVPGV